MSIPDKERAVKLEIPLMLADLGVPIFCGRLDASGDPDPRDRRWDKWQQTTPRDSLRNLRRYKDGDAIGAVGGWTMDFLDWDLRNDPDGSGREWLHKLKLQPAMRQETPSHGAHAFIPALGLPKGKVMPGVDYQGGRVDGSSRGFVFIEPTVRPSKFKDDYGTLRPYSLQVLRELPPASEFNFLKSAIEAARNGSNGSGSAPNGHRQAPSVLREACLTAEAGGQRHALLRIIKEWQYRGYEQEDVLNLFVQLVSEMPCFDDSDPWYPARGPHPGRWFNSLLKQAGTFIVDAQPGELDGASDFEPVRSGLVMSLESVQERTTDWLWKLYLARGEISLIDGEKGVGKSTCWFDVAARGSRGAPMPGEVSGDGSCWSTLILSPENRTEQIIKPRLRAAGANMSRIFMPAIPSSRRGKSPEMYLLPDSAMKIGQMILAANASLLIIDPIPAFLMPNINSHNDASVRTALAPLARVLADLGCAAGFSRNMNKNTAVEDRYRGSGSQAFADLARVHLVVTRLPSDSGAPGSFGLSQAVANMTRKEDRTLCFSIEDSEVPLDDDGNMISHVVWHGLYLVSLGASRRGPRPVEQDKIREVLSEIYSDGGSFEPSYVLEMLSAAGCSTNKVTVAKVRDEMGIVAVPVYIRGKRGVTGWKWTMESQRSRVGDTEA